MFIPLLSPLNWHRLQTIRNSDVPDVSGIADPLAGEGLVSECQSQDNFNKTEARSVPALGKFDLRSTVDQSVVTLIRLGWGNSRVATVPPTFQ